MYHNCPDDCKWTLSCSYLVLLTAGLCADVHMCIVRAYLSFDYQDEKVHRYFVLTD